MNFKEKLFHKASDLQVDLSDIQLNQFELYYQMLIKKNKVMNLTSIIEEDEVIDKHFIDSLTCKRVIDINDVDHVIDVGTGAGFPGIPLKIAYPDTEFVLVDSLKKRICFLEEVTEKLGLTGIKAIHGRAEDLGRDKKYRDSFDLCLSRAVANLNTLTEYCIPFVKVNGFFISYKSRKGLEEVKNLDNCMKLLGSDIVKIDQFTLSDIESERVLIKIKKLKTTSKKYPRRAGIPSKDPL